MERCVEPAPIVANKLDEEALETPGIESGPGTYFERS